MLINFVGCDRIDAGVKVESWHFRVILPDVYRSRIVVRNESNFSWPIVVEMRKSNFVLSSDGMPDDDFVDVVELIPILIEIT